MPHSTPISSALPSSTPVVSQGTPPPATAQRTPFARLHVEVVTAHSDARGFVFQPLSDTEISQYRNVHVVVSVPGAVRGNHMHLRGCEISSVPGPMLVRTREGGVVTDFEVPAGAVWRFAFPPGVAHAFKNTGDRVALIASFNTEIHDPNDQDVVRDLLIGT